MDESSVASTISLFSDDAELLHFFEAASHEIGYSLYSSSSFEINLPEFPQSSLIFVHEPETGKDTAISLLARLSSESQALVVYIVDASGYRISDAVMYGVDCCVQVPRDRKDLVSLIQALLRRYNEHIKTQIALSKYRDINESTNIEVNPEKIIGRGTLLTSLHQCRSISMCAWSSVVLFDTRGHPYALVQDGGRQEITVSIIRRKGHSQRIMDSGKPVIFEDVKSSDALMNTFNPIVEATGTRAVAGFPLECDQRRMGVLWYHYDTPHVFSDEVLKMLIRSAQDLASVYLPYYMEQQLYICEEIASNVDGVFVNLGNTLQYILTQDSVVTTLRAICAQAGKILETRHSCDDFYVAISIIDERANVLSVSATYPENVLYIFLLHETETLDLRNLGDTDDHNKKRRGIARRVAITGDDYYARNTLEEPDYSPIPQGYLTHYSCAIKNRDSVLGVVTVELKNPDAMTVEERRNLRFLSDLAAAAIELARKSEQREEYIQDVTHQLNGPLAGIRNYVDYLTDPNVKMIEELKNAELKRVYNLARRVQNYALNFAYASKEEHVDTWLRLREDKTTIKPGRLIQLLVEWAQNYQPEAKAKKVSGPSVHEESFQSFPVLHLNLSLFEILIMNLYDNAVKYSYKYRPVTVLGRRSQSEVQIEFKNYGVAVRPDDVEYIFQRRIRTQDAIEHSTAGTGIGLYICRRIAKLHGGDIIVIPSTRMDSKRGSEVVFVLTLPIKDE
ncbi:MAG: hypothetical protein KC547_11770 [Anaerolineae bacterium]|nr:hypothetical protein [Anaerolineae bacterium]